MKLLKETMKLVYKLGLIFLVVFLIVKGCANTNTYTEEDYYRDNPNASKSYEQFLKEEIQEQDLKEEIKNKLNQ